MSARGKVVNGRVEFEGKALPDGTDVVVLERDQDEEVELSGDEAAMLDQAISDAEADPTGGVPWDDFRRQLREER